jgi:imidazolonepropionase-like amidohydrolase
MKLKLTNCTIVDALEPHPRPGVVVHIVDDRIAWVGPVSKAPEFPATRVVDLEGGYLLPGLVEAHTHLFFLDPKFPRPQNIAAHMMYCARQAVEALKGGFTGLRNLADGFGVDVALRDAFNAGYLLGPRLWVTGEALTPSAGHVADREEMWGIRVCNGVEEWRKAARDQVQIGTDYVKVLITGGAIGHASDITGATTVVEEELMAATQVAKSRNRPLIVHATARDGILMGIRAGARSIEHGYYLDDEIVALLVKTGTFLCPTLSITHQIPSQLTDEYERATFAAYQRAPWKVKRAEERLEAHQTSFRLALKAGVKMLVGSDFAPQPGAGHCELAFMVRNGMTPWQAVVAATRNAAEAVGELDRLGTVEAGKLADLIAVDGNPLDDIRHLRHPRLVVRGGQVAVDGYTWKERK